MNTELGDRTYLAKILGAENQLLATGEVRVYTSDAHGVFWSPDLLNEDTLLKNATIAQTSEGHTLKILKFWKCPNKGFPIADHYDFDYTI